MRKSKVEKRLCAWLLVLVMMVSLVAVPAREVQAAGTSSGDVTAAVSKKSGNADWAEYNYSVTNGTESAISGIKIKVPYSGTVNNLQSWNCSAAQSDGYIVISHTAVLAAGQTYSCIGSDSIKFGFSGGASLGTPVVEFVYGEDGGGTSSSELKYELTGAVKDLAAADTPFGKHGKLNLETVSGYSAPVIVDKNGNPFQLRGASTHGIHWSEMHPYVNKGAFQSLRDEWGVNMVRLASYVTQGGYTEGSQDLLDTKLQEGVEAATELGMYVIIDWHIHAENPHTTKSNAEAFFQKYATMYKDYDNVIFEICNEPTGVVWYDGSGSDLYSYCKDIAQIIRNCGSDALIVCGTNTWSQDVDDVAKKPLKDDGFENILYTFHFYSGSHYDDKMNKVKTATAAGTPIFVTEFGICDASGNGGFDTANADAWIELLDGYNISYACWSLCNKNESASYLSTSCTKTTGGWVESDLATTGIWLVNTYRAHEDAENGTDTDTPAAKLSASVDKLAISSLEYGYSTTNTGNVTINNTGDADTVLVSAAFENGANSNFEITNNLSGNISAGGSGSVTIAAKTGLKAGTYSDNLIITYDTSKQLKIPVTLTVNKKAVTNIIFPTAGDIEVGQTLADSTLSGGDTAFGTFAWQDSTEAPAKGTYSKNVVLTLGENVKKNYSFTGVSGYDESAGTIIREVTVVVNKAGAPTITFPTASSIKYGQKLGLSILSGGSTEYGSFAWENKDVTAETVGDIPYNVVFTPNEYAIDTYELESITKPVTVKVEKADNLDMPAAISDADIVRTNSSIRIESLDGYEYSIDGGNSWKENASFTGLNSFTAYTIHYRIKETATHNPSKTVSVTVYTLVSDPYNIDVSKLNNPNYVDAVRDANGNATISYANNQLSLLKSVSEHEAGYTISGNEAELTIKADVDSKITLNNTTVKEIDVSDAAKVELVIQGEVNVINEILSNSQTDITICGDGTLNTESIRTDGSVFIEDATVHADVSGNSLTSSNTQPIQQPNIEDANPEIPATAMSVTATVKGAGEVPIKSSYKLAPKKTMQINVDFLPEDAEEEELVFTSSNTKVATVDEDGKVTAKKEGTTVITVTSKHGLKKTFKLQVVKKAITRIKLTGSKKMKVKAKQKLKVAVTPNKKYISTNLIWKSSNEKIATVSSSGQVKALKKGKVKITVYATDGSGKKASISIQVK